MIHIEQYSGNEQLDEIQDLIGENLSEAYSVYVYRYFTHQWPHLSYVALGSTGKVIGAIICKVEVHRGGPLRGYVAMLAIVKAYRGQGLASRLVCTAISAMKEVGAEEIVLETETDNYPAMALYQNFGFIRYKRLHRYYLNSKDAYRLILPI